MDAADAALALEPKSKDPFDSMPKGLVFVSYLVSYIKYCLQNICNG